MAGRVGSGGGLDLVEAQLIERAARRGGESVPGGAASEIAAELRRTLSQVLSNLEYLERELHRQAGDPRPGRWAELQCCAAEALSGARQARAASAALSPPPSAEDREQVDLAELLASCIRTAQRRLPVGARVIAEFGDVPPLVASEGRLGRIFLNLLLNALQAASESSGRDPIVEVVLLRDARGDVRVDVSDSGPGIPERLRDTLFEPFVTSRPAEGGRGLGLAICRRLAAELGGTIEAHDEPGRGARFSVRLPAALAGGPPPTARPSHLRSLGAGRFAPAPVPVVRLPGGATR